MKHKTDLEFIEEIASVSKNLLAHKKELARYYKEGYLHETKGHNPWIKIRIANHPTYLRDFTINMSDDDLRDGIVKLAIQQSKMYIKELEKELAELLKKASDGQKKNKS
ncbi:MAG: hypothetical protein ACXQT0_04790 [Candidatus Methanofastidiosia archaeon]